MAPESTQAASPIDGGAGWQRVHPLTPVMRSWRTVAALLALFTVRSEDALRSLVNGERHHGSPLTHLGTTALIFIAGGILLALALLLLLNWIAWRATSFRISDTSVEVRRGVVVHQHRNARLDRVQAVDVLQPLVPRLFGLAELSFDVAGSGSHSLRISMLKRAEAETLRDVILRRARETHGSEQDDARTQESDLSTATRAGSIGNKATDDPYGAPGVAGYSVPPFSEARQNRAGRPRTVGTRLMQTLAREGAAVGEDISQTLESTFAAYGAHTQVRADGRIVHVPPHRVLGAVLLRPATLVALIWLVIGVVSVIVGSSTGNAGTGWGIAFTTLLTAITFLHSTVQGALRQANFSAALTADGLLITQGVTSTERRVIPLDRIQAVGLEQPLMWRPFGWWRAHYNIASQSTSQDVGRTVTALLPVGSVDDAVAMLSLALPIEPDGTSDAQATGELLRDATRAVPTSLQHQPGASRWVDPICWRVNGWGRTATLTLIRHGRLKRRVACIPHARVQSLALHEGPVQRRLGLATLSLHSTEGPVGGTIRHQAAKAARPMLFELAEITREARRAEQHRASGPGSGAPTFSTLPE